MPLEAPIRHANGCHWGRFVRTIVEVETDEGITGLGEMGGGGESAEGAFRALNKYLVDRNVHVNYIQQKTSSLEEKFLAILKENEKVVNPPLPR